MTISRVREIFRKKISIPTLPKTVLKVQQMVEDPKAGTKEIGAFPENESSSQLYRELYRGARSEQRQALLRLSLCRVPMVQL